ncbi:hypothetical protein [Desulfoscipio geothermicus]|uniref:CobQ/CobB/MinD/ParA nucleotide binding domain-containing protein n=1 Tax=Desulfoscipio geothermicus DSM 3669 TaxID=1121426 RepID=A0A1I6DAN6_9FIRM|nr:hypothetical protein [Desulfoscipio geothermicus]SFR02526.1 hypothetical protein SAMN05660706_10819 [Desulfoscipio geothermicus DSM 3669]
MINNVRRITIFTGNLGSGKTELAINFALWLKKKHQRVGIVDLDIINPYFRTRIMKDYLEKMGLRVICPPGKLAGADVPALSPAILGVLEDEQGMGVFDVGGDDIGATALGRFKPYLPEGAYHMYFVANACRPFTGKPAGIVKMLRSVEKASRLKVTALVSNTNLGLATDPDTVMAGHAVVEEAARQLQLPVAFMAVKSDLAPEMTRRVPQVPVFPVDLRMLPPWLRE